MKYRPDIDGLRAIAVSSVVFYHAQVPGITGGFVGVDIFFVISGYLICSIIIAELKNESFSLIKFYERRCRRILPALFTMLLVTSTIGTFVLLPPDMKKLDLSLLGSTFSVSNIYFWRGTGYFDGSSELKPLLHTWSLGVEEQFYIFVPLMLMAIYKWLGGTYLRWLILLSGVSLALSTWGVVNAPTATFYLLPTRFWELAVGAIVANIPMPSKASALQRQSLIWIGVALILVAIFGFAEDTLFPGPNALVPCLGAAAIIYAGRDTNSMILKLLSTRLLVFIGRISYSLYLWHWPYLALGKYYAARELSPQEIFLLVVASLGTAIVSYRWVELPFRTYKPIFTRRMIFVSTTASMVLLTTIGTVGLATNGFSLLHPEFQLITIPGPERYRQGTCFMNDQQSLREWREDECFLSRGQGQPILLWGDSYAAHYAPGIMDLRQSISADVLQYTASLCPPILGYYTAARPNCREFNDNIFALANRYGIKTIIMSARWESLFRRGVSPNDVAVTVRRLNESGIRAIVLGQSPVYANDIQILFAKTAAEAERAKSTVSTTPSFKPIVNQSLAASLPVDIFIDPMPAFCKDGLCTYWKSGNFLFVDNGHFSTKGSGFAVNSYFPFIAR